MFGITLVALLLAAPSAAAGQAADAKDKTPQRIRSVQLQKGQACPPAAAPDEVVVCSTIEEPYRIPAPLRETSPSAVNESWVNRAATIDENGRVAAGLPDTCSPVGTGGQSGCALQINRAYAAEKRARKRGDSSVTP